MTNLSSIDYAHLIAWLAYYKFNTILNKTQMQKLLFICYGQALVINGGVPLFIDDTPKAWPFGPVFPRTYKRYEEVLPEDLSDTQKQAFAEDHDILTMIAKTVAKYHRYSATRLSDWSHQVGGPWHKTVLPDGYEVAWNKEISKDIIQEYFTNSSWEARI